ncbi:MAG TPA: hypothetical protein PKY26_02015 [Acetivibrio clariflavus]|nr:hypothetical protein [Acetivibrio clariflavus]
MDISDIISLVLLIAFAAAYILKLVFLKRREKVNANVLAKGKKIFRFIVQKCLLAYQVHCGC